MEGIHSGGTKSPSQGKMAYGRAGFSKGDELPLSHLLLFSPFFYMRANFPFCPSLNREKLQIAPLIFLQDVTPYISIKGKILHFTSLLKAKSLFSNHSSRSPTITMEGF